MEAKLARVLAEGSKSGALLALATALVTVGVFGRQLVTPLAVGFACVPRRESLSAPAVFPVAVNRFPVRWILARAMLAGVTSGAFGITVVARVIHDIARFKGGNKLLKAIAVGTHGTPLPVRVLPVVLLIACAGPRPAVGRPAPVNEREVPLKPCHVPAQRAAPYPGPEQLVVVARTQPLCLRGFIAFAAHAFHAPAAWFKRVSVLPKSLIVVAAQPAGPCGAVAVLAIRHDTILARSACKKAVPRHGL